MNTNEEASAKQSQTERLAAHPTYDPVERPFALAVGVDMRKVMKTDETSNMWQKWMIVNEMERRLRIKHHKLVKQMYHINPQTGKLLPMLMGRIADLQQCLRGIVYRRKQQWLEDVMFSEDADVKDMVNEDFIRQTMGVMKSRKEEAETLISLAREPQYAEMLDRDPMCFVAFLHTEKADWYNDEAPVWSGLEGVGEGEDAPDEPSGKFLSDKCLHTILRSTTLNKDNPLRKYGGQEWMSMKMYELFMNDTSYDFAWINHSVMDKLDECHRAEVEEYAKKCAENHY